VTRLERRCRRLLHAYPAEYRRDRGDEIIGTLLESTPDGRAWPQLRDVRALLVGGLRARAALSRQRTATANLRIAVLVGVTAYLCLFVPRALVEVRWPQTLVALVLAVACVVAWVSRSRPTVLVSVVAGIAVVSYAGPWGTNSLGAPVTDLACLVTLLVVGGGRERPGTTWLWPLALIVASAILPVAGRTLPWAGLHLLLMLGLGVLSIALLVVDARPVIAAAVCVLALWLLLAIDSVTVNLSPLAGLPVLIIGVAGGGAFWRLGRQSAR
jgi:hypothetical protein